MRTLKKILVFACCSLLVAASLIACNKSSSTKESANRSGQFPGNFFSDNENSKYGKVTAIDGKKVTLALLEMPQMGNRSGSDSNDGTDQGRKFNGDAAPSGFPNNGQKPNGDAAPSGFPDNGQQPNGNAAPSGFPGNGKNPNRNMSDFFKETGETLEITVDDESIIKVRSGQEEKSGSLKDITVDSILVVQYADDGSISAIIVQGTNPGATASPKL